jgi:hypothetical protein
MEGADRLARQRRLRRHLRALGARARRRRHDTLPDNVVPLYRHRIASMPTAAFLVSHLKMASGIDLGLVEQRYERRYGDKPIGARWPLPNVWLGVSVEDQEYAARRIPHLLSTPAAVRFVSYEPALGPVDFRRLKCSDPGGDYFFDSLAPPAPLFHHQPLDWVIMGGESGPGARPMDPAWVRSTRDQCAGAGVPFFFKQWGGLLKKRSGRELDGRTHDAMPSVAVASRR